MKRVREVSVHNPFIGDPLDPDMAALKESGLQYIQEVRDALAEGEEGQTYDDFLKLNRFFLTGVMYESQYVVKLQRIFRDQPQLNRGYINFRYGRLNMRCCRPGKLIEDQKHTQAERILNFLETRMKDDPCLLNDMLSRYQLEITPVAGLDQEVNSLNGGGDGSNMPEDDADSTLWQANFLNRRTTKPQVRPPILHTYSRRPKSTRMISESHQYKQKENEVFRAPST